MEVFNTTVNLKLILFISLTTLIKSTKAVISEIFLYYTEGFTTYCFILNEEHFLFLKEYVIETYYLIVKLSLKDFKDAIRQGIVYTF